jgi:hypothetical protein
MIFAAQRLKALPNVPTGKEAGVDAGSQSTVRGFVTARGVPAERIKALEEGLVKAMQGQMFTTYLENSGQALDSVAGAGPWKKQLDQLRKQNAQGGGSFRQHPETTKARALLCDDARGLMPVSGDDRRGGTIASPGDDTTSDGTINALIANSSWSEKKPGVGRGQATATVDTTPELAHGEMLSPDLVFTEKDKEKDEER